MPKPGQILDAILIRQFPLTQTSFGYGTSAIGSSMKLAFKPYMDHRNQTLYVAWASNLMQTAPGLRGGLEVDLDWASTSSWMPLLVLHASKPLSMHLLGISFVPNHNIIIG